METIGQESQTEKIKIYHKGFFATHLINIGNKLGIFEALKDENEGITVTGLAAKTGLYEPYLKFWCQTAYFFEILDCDNEGKFRYQPHMDKILGDKSNLPNLLSDNNMFVNLHGERLKDNIELFRTGGILEEYAPERSEIVADISKLGHKLLVSYISSLDESHPLKRILNQGGKILDVGCGAGNFIIQLAQSYKNSKFIGIDPVSYGIEAGKKVISDLALDNQIFLMTLGGEEINYKDEFDLVFMLAVFHEILPHKRIKVMENIYQALKNDGRLWISDPSYPSSIEDFRNPSFELGIIDQFIEIQIGTVILNELEINEMFTKIGFKNIKHTIFQGVDNITAKK